jgi:hypothetical protein
MGYEIYKTKMLRHCGHCVRELSLFFCVLQKSVISWCLLNRDCYSIRVHRDRHKYVQNNDFPAQTATTADIFFPFFAFLPSLLPLFCIYLSNFCLYNDALSTPKVLKFRTRWRKDKNAGHIRI